MRIDWMRIKYFGLGGVVLAGICLAPGVWALVGPPQGTPNLPTTTEDFFQPGTQPEPDSEQFAPIVSSQSCSFCHADYQPTESAPYDSWISSLMAQSARDPVWQAALTISNQDAAVSGEYCIRCHAPRPWLAGKSSDGEITDFDEFDFEGVNCHFCHRMVNPDLGEDSAVGILEAEGEMPDGPILAELMNEGVFPEQTGNARFIVDPESVRRGPFADVPMNLHNPDPIYFSPFHQESALCGTCHDVGNPIYTLAEDGSYDLNDLDAEHPTQNPYEMFPEQRTYSEWLNSDFADGGVVFPDGRFGGNLPDDVPIASCQDCHMPDQFGGGCSFYQQDPFFAREDVPQHAFNGANTWVIAGIRDLLGPDQADNIGLTAERVQESQARTVQMLRDASDMELSVESDQLNVRVINVSGHKLPTGYPEGRRAWLNVQYYDKNEQLIEEFGEYDFKTAELTEDDTKVYEVLMGLDEDAAEATGLPVGKSFHLSLNNDILKDNRIPPMGFTNESFEAVQAEPVDYTYADGQHWDDTLYTIPRNATEAVVTLYYQTSTKEYMEFLQEENVTDDRGDVVVGAWLEQGMSPPVDMDVVMIDLDEGVFGDLNGDGFVDGSDLGLLLGNWGGEGVGDLDESGMVDGSDLGLLLGAWTT